MEKFINSHGKKYDQGDQVTWIDSVGNLPFGHKGIYTYMGMKNNIKWLRAKIHYSGEDLIIFEKIIFSNTKESWTYNLGGKMPKCDIVWGGSHATLDVKFEDLLEGMKIVAFGKNPRIDFVGHGEKSVKLLTQYEIDNYRTYLQLQKCIDD